MARVTPDQQVGQQDDDGRIQKTVRGDREGNDGGGSSKRVPSTAALGQADRSDVGGYSAYDRVSRKRDGRRSRYGFLRRRRCGATA